MTLLSPEQSQTLIFKLESGDELRITPFSELEFAGRSYTALVQEAHLEQMLAILSQGGQPANPEVMFALHTADGKYLPVESEGILDALSTLLEDELKAVHAAPTPETLSALLMPRRITLVPQVVGAAQPPIIPDGR